MANAEHNDSQGRDELYVAACFADEGPTLRRFRPRARGRATRIRKRTCHITIDRGPHVRGGAGAQAAPRGGAAADRSPWRPRRRRLPTASRRARVAKSRQAAAARDAVDETVDTGATEDERRTTTDDADTEAIETGEVESAEVDDGDETVDEVDDEAPYGPGSHAALEDDEQPEGFAIKGNADSMLYHVPGSRSYNQTKAEVWFATEDDAEAAGFSKPPSQQADDDDDDTEDDS